MQPFQGRLPLLLTQGRVAKSATLPWALLFNRFAVTIIAKTMRGIRRNAGAPRGAVIRVKRPFDHVIVDMVGFFFFPISYPLPTAVGQRRLN
jgi:hypothetical protein